MESVTYDDLESSESILLRVLLPRYHLNLPTNVFNIILSTLITSRCLLTIDEITENGR